MSDDTTQDNVEEEEQQSVQEEDVVKVPKEEWELLSERSKKADEMAEELEKLRKKDYNFRQLEGKTEKEKEKIREKVEKKEAKLEQEREEIESLKKELDDKHQSFVRSQLESTHKSVLDDLCGDDPELRARVEKEAGYIVGPMNNRDQIEDKYKKAYTLATGNAPKADPFARTGTMTTSGFSSSNPKKYTETERGKRNYDTWFPDSKRIQAHKEAREKTGDNLAGRHLL